MHLAITVISVLMISDAAFTLLNISKVESFLKEYFPSMNVKKLAMVEGAAGALILLLKIATGTIT